MLPQIWLFTLISVLIVSLISLVGIIAFSIKSEKLRIFLIYLISFAAGTLFGDAFIHLLPETIENNVSPEKIAIFILAGITLFFILEKIIHWRHCHGCITEKNHVHSFAYMNLVGDGLHNFLDGVIIAAGYLISTPAGIATTIAVVLHEIPQEIGDFGVLLHGGFSKTKALFMNFLSALLAVLGAVTALWLQGFVENIETFIVPIAIGGFIYIAGSDLIPQMHKDSEKLGRSLLQLIAFIAGISVMAMLLFLE